LASQAGANEWECGNDCFTPELGDSQNRYNPGWDVCQHSLEGSSQWCKLQLSTPRQAALRWQQKKTKDLGNRAWGPGRFKGTQGVGDSLDESRSNLTE